MATKFDLRNCALVLAGFVGLYSIWFLAAELLRPRLESELRLLATIPESSIVSIRSATGRAAAVGMIRADLWAERALVDGAKIVDERIMPDDTLSQAQAAETRVSAERAVANGPLFAPVWLVLANLSFKVKEQRHLASDQLKMSYFTGPNDQTIMGRRLSLLSRFATIDDDNLRNAVRREIRTILLRAPDLRQRIIDAHRQAQTEPRKFIEAAVLEVDPVFFASLRRTP
jgi:hypothetical protein